MKYFNFKFLTVLFALALAIPLAVGAEEVTVCDGEESTEYLPIYGYYGDVAQHNQMIYPASELGNLPSGAIITSITFYPDGSIPSALQGLNVTFSMANMDPGNVFETDTWGNATGALDVDVDQVASVTVNNNPWVITLDDPFEYTGGDLLIDVLTPDVDYAHLYFTCMSFDQYYGFYSYGTSTKKGMKELPKLTITYEVGELDPYKAKITPTSIDFGNTAPNNSLTQNVTVKNTGENPFTPSVTGLAAPFSTTYTPAPIAKGETATIPIVFNPTTTGDFEATILVGDAGGNITPVEIPLTGSAAYSATVANGTTTNAYVPFYGYYYDNMQINQMIYPEDMLTDLKGKIIKGITFYTYEELAFYNGVYDVQIGTTDNTSYDSKVRITDGLSTVATDLTAAKGGQELTINFSNPFTYTGGNLLIDINVKTKGSWGRNNFYGVEANAASFNSYGTSSVNNDGVYSGGSIQDFLPKITFAYVDGGEVPVTVAAPVFDPEDGTTFEENLTVTLTCTTADATIQYSLNGEYFTDYEEPIVIDETTTIYAKAVLGDVESEVVSATYTKGAAPQPGETTTFVKVTDADQLVAGKKYIIVCDNKAMGADATGKFLTAIDITAGDEVQAVDGVAIMTLDGTLGHYTLKLGDQYLSAGNSTDLKIGTNATEWAISDYNGTLDGYRVKHADYNRAVRYTAGYNRFGNYSTTDENSDYGWIYVEKEEVTPEPEQVATPTFDPEEGTYTEAQNVTITCETEDATIHYTTDGTEPTADSPVYEEAIAVGETMTIKAIAMKEGMTDSEIDSATYTINIPVPVVVAAPTFTPEPGSYTEAQTVTIACTTEDAVVYYSTDGGESWTEGNTVTVNEDMTLMAKAVVGDVETVANAVYSFEFPVAPIDMEPFDGYFYVKNLGNEQYANVVGRKTLRFTDAPEDKAGTVIRLKTDEHGQVISLRSQACDLQGYANKAMNYVPEFVHLVADKLELEGVGQLFGETGVDAILDKFNEAFDHHLYVEPAEGGYRIYGKTPSMQHVVDFYRENQAKCDAKLPMLEEAINNAIDKILEKTNGSGASILEYFSLHTIWEKMNNPYLTEPVDDASTMAFYHQVLMNKDFVWDFAYETAMIYWTNLKNHPRYENEIKPQLGEFAEYLDKIENVRPNFKYYIVQKNDKPDFISEGNTDIKNNAPRTIWSVEPRTEFVVNVPEEATYFNKYVTTLYTDFAYDLPEGVIAYKVVGINDDAYAQIKAIDGTIPAQMPVLLISKTAGDLTLTLNNNDGKAHSDNQLKGPDYLIGQYQLKSPTVEKIFNLVKSLFGEEIYNNYMLDYEHLMLRYAGNVKNKYFFGLSEEDVAACGITNEYDQVECVVRSLEPTEGDYAAFYNNGIVSSNKAFLVNDTYDPIKIMIKGDIDRNGKANIADVTALIDIMLYLPDTPFTDQYDYEAADFDENGEIKIKDLTELIDYLLDNGIEGGNGTTDDDDIVYDN